MKKIGINLIIGSLITIVLIVISLLVIKPNYTYLLSFNDKIYVSQNNSTYNVDNDEISFSKRDKKINISVKTDSSNTIYEDKVVYDTETGYTIFAIEGEPNKIFDATITFNDDSSKISSSSKELSYDEMLLAYKYSNLINAKINGIGLEKVNKDRISATIQKVICSILSVFIGFILSLFIYPVILYEKLKENQKLAVISIGLTLILCISSGFYIFFTLK